MHKILVIDDDANIRNYLETLLIRLGYKVVLACNGKDGLLLAGNPDIDIIISDLCMPETPSGLDLIRQFRTTWPERPTVVISGKGDQMVVAECIALGVTEFLTKPFEIGFIKEVLERQAPKRVASTEAHDR